MPKRPMTNRDVEKLNRHINRNNPSAFVRLLQRVDFPEEILQDIITRHTAFFQTADSVGQTVAHYAVMQGEFNFFQLLLQANVKMLNLLDDCRQSPLFFAVRLGRIEFIRLMLEEDASILLQQDDVGNYPIHMAAQKGAADIIELMLEFNPTLMKLTGRSGYTCAHYAARHDNAELFAKLIELWPQMMAIQDTEGQTPVHIAARYGSHRAFQMMVSKNPKSLVLKDKRGLTAVHHCVMSDNIESLSVVANKYPEALLHKDSDGQIAIHHAATQYDMSALKLLIDTNRELLKEVDDDKRSALHLAAESGNVAAVQLILKHHPDIAMHKDAQGRTALHLAVNNGHNNCAQLLQEAYPALFVQMDSFGDTPAMLAAEMGNTDLLPVMLQAGAVLKPENIYADEINHMIQIHRSTAYKEMLREAQLEIALLSNASRRYNPAIVDEFLHRCNQQMQTWHHKRIKVDVAQDASSSGDASLDEDSLQPMLSGLSQRLDLLVSAREVREQYKNGEVVELWKHLYETDTEIQKIACVLCNQLLLDSSDNEMDMLKAYSQDVVIRMADANWGNQNFISIGWTDLLSRLMNQSSHQQQVAYLQELLADIKGLPQMQLAAVQNNLLIVLSEMASYAFDVDKELYKVIQGELIKSYEPLDIDRLSRGVVRQHSLKLSDGLNKLDAALKAIASGIREPLVLAERKVEFEGLQHKEARQLLENLHKRVQQIFPAEKADDKALQGLMNYYSQNKPVIDEVFQRLGYVDPLTDVLSAIQKDHQEIHDNQQQQAMILAKSVFGKKANPSELAIQDLMSVHTRFLTQVLNQVKADAKITPARQRHLHNEAILKLKPILAPSKLTLENVLGIIKVLDTDNIVTEQLRESDQFKNISEVSRKIKDDLLAMSIEHREKDKFRAKKVGYKMKKKK